MSKITYSVMIKYETCHNTEYILQLFHFLGAFATQKLQKLPISFSISVCM
jgi:hypothetical protein